MALVIVLNLRNLIGMIKNSCYFDGSKSAIGLGERD